MKPCALFDDPERRTAMGEIGRQRVQSGLAWHHPIPRLLEAYESTMRSVRARSKSFGAPSA
jgi:hypothetical protein